MKLSVTMGPDGKNKTYVMTHTTPDGVEVLELGPFQQARVYKTVAEIEDLLKDINDYLASRTEENQRMMFDLYKDIVELVSSTRSLYEMQSRINPLFCELLDVHYSKEEVSDFIDNSDIEYPSTVMETFEDDGRRRRERTYIRSEYRGLAGVALISHGMAPLWSLIAGCLSAADKDDFITTNLSIMQTFSKSRFLNDSEWIGRLYEMIVFLVDNDVKETIKLHIKVAGAGSESIPPFILMSILMLKLPGCKILHPTEKNIIVTANSAVNGEVVRYGSSQTRYFERSETRMSDDDEKIGFLESYCTRQRVSDDIHIVNEVYLNNWRQVKNDLDDSIPNNLVLACYNSLQEHPIYAINVVHVTLVQWCLNRSIKIDKETGKRRRLIMPKAVWYLPRDTMLKAMAITQAALISWGFESIARYLSSTPSMKEPLDLIEGSGIIATEVTKQQKQVLDKTHPYLRPSAGNNPAVTNMAVDSIKQLVLQIDEYDWELKCSSEVEDALNENSGFIELDQLIKFKLVELIQLIAK